MLAVLRVENFTESLFPAANFERVNIWARNDKYPCL